MSNTNSNSDFTIRQAQKSDSPQVQKLLQESEFFHCQNLPGIFLKTDEPLQNEQFVMALLLDDETGLFVAELAGNLIGVIHVNIGCYPEIPIFTDEKFSVIQNLIVNEEYRDMGVGKALFNAVESWSAQKKLSKIQLNVWEFNQSAIRMYENIGFKTLNRRLEIDIHSNETG